MHIRREGPHDAPAIAALNRLAFGGEFEAGLIDRLRADGMVAVSLVAISNDTIVGHILFSELGTEIDGREVKAVALAPMCVRNDCQRQGIGTALVRTGLAAAAGAGYQAVVVVGHPDYYPRFGFSSCLTEILASPYAGPACMGLELVAGALHGTRGKVTYPTAFGSGKAAVP